MIYIFENGRQIHDPNLLREQDKGKYLTIDALPSVALQPNQHVRFYADLELGQVVHVIHDIEESNLRSAMVSGNEADVSAVTKEDARFALLATHLGMDIKIDTQVLIEAAFADMPVKHLQNNDNWQSGYRVMQGTTIRHSNQLFECQETHITQAHNEPIISLAEGEGSLGLRLLDMALADDAVGMEALQGERVTQVAQHNPWAAVIAPGGGRVGRE